MSVNFFSTLLEELPERQQKRMGAYVPDFRIQYERGGITRDEDPHDHWCAYFVPFYRETKQVYMVHHKKAGAWIPPGGHLEMFENPKTTVIREMEEELHAVITEDQVRFMGMEWLWLQPAPSQCRRHWHLWFSVEMPEKVDFEWSRREFYGALWMSLEHAITLLVPQAQRTILYQLR